MGMDLYSRPRCAFCRFGRLAALLIGAVQFDIVGEKRIMAWYMHVPSGGCRMRIKEGLKTMEMLICMKI
jgi:hypothetical protein